MSQTVKKSDFQRCFETVIFCAWAYKSEQHLHSDMEHPKYFTAIRSRLRPGDHIFAIDAAMQYKTYVIDAIDEEAQEVRLSMMTEHKLTPVLAENEELTHRWRGPRGGGHCIVDANGDVVESGFNSKQSAKHEIERRRMAAEIKKQAA